MRLTATVHCAHAEREPFGTPQLRAWRPFPRRQLDVICEEVTAHRVGIHVHEEVQITLPVTTLQMVDGAGRMEPLAPGCIGILNSGDLHGSVSLTSEPWSARVLLVPWEVMAQLGERTDAQSPRRPPRFPRRVISDAVLAAELNALFDELRRLPASETAESRLRGCLARLGAAHGEPPRAVYGPARCRRGVQRVREYLQANVSERVSLAELAGVACLSKYYLLRTFTREHGMSPHAYQMTLRVARARTLLAHGGSPSHAAYDAGFADQSHLTRRMRAACGITPAAYARLFGDFTRDTRMGIPTRAPDYQVATAA